ncbi:MAG: apolipoprotein N-acyltransferase [Labilithrix sp.]
MVSRSIGERLTTFEAGLSERRRDLIALASGFVFAADAPPINFTAGILLGLGLLAFSRPNAKRGFYFGLAANLEALRFVPDVIARFTTLHWTLGILALVLLAAGQAVPWTLGMLLTRRLRDRQGIPAPLAFAIGIYAGTLIPAIFPWTPAGGLSPWPILIQASDAIGERGVSMMCALAMALLVTFQRRQMAVAAATFVVLLGYGGIRMHTIDAARESAPHAKVALVMPDFDPLERSKPGGLGATGMLDRLWDLTREAETEDAYLTVWPESAYPYALKHGISRSPRGEGRMLQNGVHGPVLTGAYLSKTEYMGTNSAIMIYADGSIPPSYDKRHLLWFGETVPLADQIPVLREIFARGLGLDAGTTSVPLKVGIINSSVLNCYEDTLPIAGREAMEPRPNLLINVTNDAWFAGTQESELHLRTAVPRAIETRRDMVRAVNRGPTTWVDANGRIVARLDPAKGPAYLMTNPALLEAPLTLYSRAGELPMFLLSVAIVAALVLRQRQRSMAEKVRPQVTGSNEEPEATK